MLIEGGGERLGAKAGWFYHVSPSSVVQGREQYQIYAGRESARAAEGGEGEGARADTQYIEARETRQRITKPIFPNRLNQTRKNDARNAAMPCAPT